MSSDAQTGMATNQATSQQQSRNLSLSFLSYGQADDIKVTSEF